MAASHPPSGWLSPPSHEAKSTRERLRTGDTAGQTDTGKSIDRLAYSFFFFMSKEWQVGNASTSADKADVSGS